MNWMLLMCWPHDSSTHSMCTQAFSTQQQQNYNITLNNHRLTVAVFCFGVCVFGAFERKGLTPKNRKAFVFSNQISVLFSFLTVDVFGSHKPHEHPFSVLVVYSFMFPALFQFGTDVSAMVDPPPPPPPPHPPPLPKKEKEKKKKKKKKKKRRKKRAYLSV